MLDLKKYVRVKEQIEEKYFIVYNAFCYKLSRGENVYKDNYILHIKFILNDNQFVSNEFYSS